MLNLAHLDKRNSHDALMEKLTPLVGQSAETTEVFGFSVPRATTLARLWQDQRSCQSLNAEQPVLTLSELSNVKVGQHHQENIIVRMIIYLYNVQRCAVLLSPGMTTSYCVLMGTPAPSGPDVLIVAVSASSAPRTSTPATTWTPTMSSSVHLTVLNMGTRELPAMLILMEMINNFRTFYNSYSISIYVFISSFLLMKRCRRRSHCHYLVLTG